MAETNTKYPWHNIVKFYKDILDLDQDDVFKFTLKENGQLDPYRSAHLEGFSPEKLADTWQVPANNFSSVPLLKDIKAGKIKEGYLGGPCWSDWDNFNKCSFISPLIYQHVQIEWSEEENSVVIIPDEARWDIPPLLYEKMEKLEFSPEYPVEELPFKIIEKAHLNKEGGNASLSDYLKAEAVSEIPVFSEIFSPKKPPAVLTKNPNLWAFFIFPEKANLISQHLVPDYNDLGHILEKSPENIGGFNIFEESYNPKLYDSSEVTADPIIPLNTSQGFAVGGMLDKKPITVISGPPGCGKSQVVVSLLLNAWARGKSVLFTSNTKAAVDVVFERLKSFECEYPIAIRAGAKDKNNINDSLDKLRFLSVTQVPSPSDIRKLEKRISDEYSKKKELQNLIDDKIPQRISQAKKAGWNNYLKGKEFADYINRHREPFAKKISSIGYPDISPESFEDNVYRPLNEWLESIGKYRYLISNDKKQMQDYQNKLFRFESERDSELKNLGYNLSDSKDYGWILRGPDNEQFEIWLGNYQKFLNDTEDSFFDDTLKSEHRQWSGDNEALSWSANATDLREKIGIFSSRYSGKINDYNDVSGRYRDIKKILIQEKLSERIPFDSSLLRQWKSEYLQYLTIPDGMLSIMKRKSSEKQLQGYEREFMSYFPAQIWLSFSSDSKTGRIKLSELVDLTIEFSEILKEWENFGSDKVDIENQLKDIEAKVKSLKLPYSFSGEDISGVISTISDVLDKKIPLSREAVAAWKQHEKQKKCKEELQKHLYKYESLVSSSPIFSAWLDSYGYDFNQLMVSLNVDASANQLFKAKNFSYDRQFSELLIKWKRLIELQKQIEEYRSYSSEIPTEGKRIEEWWEEKPGLCLSNIIEDHYEFPEEGHVLYQHLNVCRVICEKWNELCDKSLNKANKAKRTYSLRAIENLRESYDNIPESLLTNDMKEIIVPLLNQDPDDLNWFCGDDERVFDDFNIDRIQARITNLNTILGDLSLELGKKKYILRIEEGDHILEDLDYLYKYLKKTYGRARGFPPERYVNALKAAPIWMTNGHQPQSLLLAPEVFDILVIDEASQCTLLNMLPLIYRAKSIAVIGDPEQLPAIRNIKPEKEKMIAYNNDMMDYQNKFGYSDNTMFNLGLNFLPGGRKNMIQLAEHYRSHPLIIGFSNLYIYQMRLSLKREDISAGKSSTMGVFGLDVKGRCKRVSGSWVNPKEAEQVCNVIDDLRNNEGLMHKSIGVVTPFRPQKYEIEKILEERGISADDVLVGTVDVFQGSERDIIIFSPVISSGINPGTAAWSDDKNRINVALTRARDLLVVVADYDACRIQDKILSKLIDYVETVSNLRDTSMEELELYSLMLMEGGDLKISSSNLPKIHQRIGAIEVDFVLRNPEKGVRVVVEVDGKQHYYVEVKDTKYSVKYLGMKRYIDINGEKHPLNRMGGEEYVEIGGINYPAVQTKDSVAQDKIRDEFLLSEGFKVFRVPTEDIRDQPAVVMNKLKKVLEIID